MSLKRLIATCAAAILCASAGAQVPLTPPDATPLQKTALISNHRGSTDRVIANTPSGDFTSRDLYLWLVMTGNAQPLLLEKHDATKAPEKRREIVERIMRQVRLMSLTWQLAERGARKSAVSQTDQLRMRMYTHPVHAINWLDHAIRPDIRIVPEDILKYYNEHPDVAEAPRRATVRYIFIEGGDPERRPGGNRPTGPGWRRAAERMEEIRDAISTGEISFEEAAQRWSEMPSAKDGGLISFEENTLFPAFEQQAFDIDVGQIGSITPGPKGFYLIQPVEQRTERKKPIEEVRDTIIDLLYFQQLEYRYKYEAALLAKDYPVLNRGAFVAGLDQHATILTVGKLRLQQGQAWDIFPEFVDEEFQVNTLNINHQLQALARHEILAQINEKNGWQNEPLIVRAQDIARMLLLAGEETDRMAAARISLDASDLRERIVGLRDKFSVEPTDSETVATELLYKGPGQAYRNLTSERFSLVQVTIKEAPSLGPARRDWELKRMANLMRGARDAARTRTLEEIIAAWPWHGVHPARIVPELIAYDLAREASEFTAVTVWDSTRPETDLDDATLKQVADVRQTLDTWTDRDMRFLPIMENEDSITLFYVEQPDYLSPEVFDQLRLDFHKILAEAVRIQMLTQARNELVPENSITLTLE